MNYKIKFFNLSDNKRPISSRKLHRIMYSLLSQYKVAAAFTFVFGFLRGNFPCEIKNDNCCEDTKKRVLYSIMKQMDCQNVTTLIQSFARIWLSYYNKKMISIYPFHRAHSILPEKQVYKGIPSFWFKGLVCAKNISILWSKLRLDVIIKS